MGTAVQRGVSVLVAFTARLTFYVLKLVNISGAFQKLCKYFLH